jgi:hypothetical protein
MPTQDDELLGLVTELDKTLDRYLSGSAAASDVAPKLLETCQRMRARAPGAPAEYWLRAIEHHVKELANPRKREGADAHFLASHGFLGVQLLKDIYYLRTQLMRARAAVH